MKGLPHCISSEVEDFTHIAITAWKQEALYNGEGLKTLQGNKGFQIVTYELCLSTVRRTSASELSIKSLTCSSAISTIIVLILQNRKLQATGHRTQSPEKEHMIVL